MRFLTFTSAADALAANNIITALGTRAKAKAGVPVNEAGQLLSVDARTGEVGRVVTARWSPVWRDGGGAELYAIVHPEEDPLWDAPLKDRPATLATEFGLLVTQEQWNALADGLAIPRAGDFDATQVIELTGEQWVTAVFTLRGIAATPADDFNIGPVVTE